MTNSASLEKIDTVTTDKLLIKIADYIHHPPKFSALAYETATLSLLDSMACLILGLQVPKCQALLGPIVSGTEVPLGARVPGTRFVLDPIKAAFDIGTSIRWLDYNDTWLAKEWGHPSDNLGGILAIADFLSQQSRSKNSHTDNPIGTTDNPILMQTVLEAMIQAYEIQGMLALDNAFNAVGLDHVVLVKVATTAVVSKLLGLSRDQTIDAISNAWIDGQSLRTYRHAPNTGSRKSWAAGDATSRGVRLAWLTLQGEQGYKTALSAKRWGFCDSVFGGKPIHLEASLDSYVMENILFKVSFPAEFHAQTAVECALKLYTSVKDKWDEIESIEIMTQEPAMRIICKEGPLYNYADRDHCLQYMIAIPLLFGQLTAEHYSDAAALDPRIDVLRSKMQVIENKQYTKDYLDPDKRSIANAVRIVFKDGTKTDQVEVEYPLGHKRRRLEALPLLKEKYYQAIQGFFLGQSGTERLLKFWDEQALIASLSVCDFMDAWVMG